MNNIILVNKKLNTTFYVVDFCVIPHFGNPLTHAVHLMSYLHDILNLA